MEEILASIRRIISEDDAPAAEQAAAPAAAPVVEAAPEPEPVLAQVQPEPVFEPELDDVLELTQKVHEEPPAPVHNPFDDIEATPVEPQAPPPVARAAPAPVSLPPQPEEALISQRAAESAASHFGALAQTVFMPGEGRTLEDVVRELLRPMLKDWLDTYLTAIVEAKVQSEVERISRRRTY
jgi:cell pole-organizing protein PopZ